jgi:hypothetical protein
LSQSSQSSLRRVEASRATLPIYAAALGISAFLLFWVQPLVAKMLLPLLGGAPAVWNTAMMFFQIMLLLGYLYAHVLSRHVAAARQPWVHAAVVLGAIAFLPVAIGADVPPTDSSPIAWLLGRLALSVGLPFFALSASAPLLQSWFNRTSHITAADPYFLYVASNLGSLLALVAFPVLIEPWLPLELQSRLWLGLYFILVVSIALCAAFMQTRAGTKAPEPTPSVCSPLPWRERLAWVALAFVPSSLLLGVTSYVMMDVASAPLLWLLPLALYLLSFVIVFARRPLIGLAFSLRGQAIGMSTLLLLFVLPYPPLGVSIAAHFATFFLTALVCHGALAARRPAAAHLTEFYLWISIGGALGGVFNALIAPVLFSSTYEYPLVLVLACLLRQAAASPPKPAWSDLLAPLAILASMVALIVLWTDIVALGWQLLALNLVLVVTAVFCLSDRAVRYGLAVAAVVVPVTVARSAEGVLETKRSFFGVSRVVSDRQAPLVNLVHGTVLHGAEFKDPARWRDEVLYYHPAGPIGQFFTRLRAARPAPQRVGVAGLGTGALACYARPDEAWIFFEIDPVVEALARDTRYFHYLEQCGERAKVVLGDARLSLAAERSDRYDVLVLDAFSSDAIPTHLMTREALRLYFRRLAENGVLLVNISNRHLDLWPMLDAAARDLGLARRRQFFVPSAQQASHHAIASDWVVMARGDGELAFLRGLPWSRSASTRGARPWTDDFSNILGVIRW